MRRRLLVVAAVAAIVVPAGAYGLAEVRSSRDAAGDTTTTSTSSSTTTSTTTAAPVETTAPCVVDTTLFEPARAAPADLVAALDAFVRDPTVAPHAAGLSIWIDGYGEVLAHRPDLALAPASNQKLYTAIGALAVIGADVRLVTEVRLSPAGDLVIVGGGDPTLTRFGPHSVAALAEQIQDAGLTRVPGALLVDESRHDGVRRASGWQEWQVPAYTGPLSAFMVDDNRWRADPAFLADPALGNAELVRQALAARGTTVAGPTGYAPDRSGRVVATLSSAPIGELVATMLGTSANQIADLVLKEVAVAAGSSGSVVGAAAAADTALAPLCLPLVGAVDDGSGLSRANSRSAREWRVLLQAVRDEPWWPQLHQALPVAARTGTLASRFGGTAAAANVRAKTGTIIGGTALAGYGTTAAGRAFVFSAMVNGPGAQAGAEAIDRLVAAVAAHPG